MDEVHITSYGVAVNFFVYDHCFNRTHNYFLRRNLTYNAHMQTLITHISIVEIIEEHVHGVTGENLLPPTSYPVVQLPYTMQSKRGEYTY